MLIDLLRRAARDAPERPVVVSPRGSMSYADCVLRSEAVARGLDRHGIERFACDLADPGDTLVLLAASSAAGSEACVYPPGLGEDGLRCLLSEFDHPVLVSDRAPALGRSEALALERLEVSGDQPPPAAQLAPVLILTTGTTGHQRGARHEWSRLVEAISHPDPRPGARWLLAYNLNQFGGIQVLLHVLASAATLVCAASRQPRDVIETMRETGVTHVSATPTFWRLLAGNLDVGVAGELSVKQITLGGEAVPEALLERLHGLFERARISQIYGATEFGTAVSVGDGRSGLPLSVLNRGDDADVQLRIVDGEIQMRSKVGMLGYHRGEATNRGWRPTGDLVELRGDRIEFVGRAGEIINVGGTKVHPLPIENRVAAVDGVQLAAAYARPNPVTGQIVALDVVADRGADAGALETRIRAACSTLPPAARPRRIRFVAELEIRGHKLARDRTERQP